MSLRILESALYVDDIAKAEKFYSDVLGLKLQLKDPNRHLFYGVGNSMLLIFNPATTKSKSGPVPTHGANGQGHVALTDENINFGEWRKKLKEQAIDIETEIDWPEGGHSIYFRDPAGNSIELTQPKIWGF